MLSFKNIIGKKVAAVKGPAKNKVEYILFDDGETHIRLSEQDYYCYHDASSFAREIYIYKDKDWYEAIMSDKSLVNAEEIY